MTHRFTFAFAVVRPSEGEAAIFSEHAGYIEFELVDDGWLRRSTKTSTATRSEQPSRIRGAENCDQPRKSQFGQKRVTAELGFLEACRRQFTTLHRRGGQSRKLSYVLGDSGPGGRRRRLRSDRERRDGDWRRKFCPARASVSFIQHPEVHLNRPWPPTPNTHVGHNPTVANVGLLAAGWPAIERCGTRLPDSRAHSTADHRRQLRSGSRIGSDKSHDSIY